MRLSQFPIFPTALEGTIRPMKPPGGFTVNFAIPEPLPSLPILSTDQTYTQLHLHSTTPTVHVGCRTPPRGHKIILSVTKRHVNTLIYNIKLRMYAVWNVLKSIALLQLLIKLDSLKGESEIHFLRSSFTVLSMLDHVGGF